jgi:hypothetical protein
MRLRRRPLIVAALTILMVCRWRTEILSYTNRSTYERTADEIEPRIPETSYNYSIFHRQQESPTECASFLVPKTTNYVRAPANRVDLGFKEHGRVVRVGLDLLENAPDEFLGESDEQYHFFHFLEHVLILYHTLIQSNLTSTNSRIAWLHSSAYPDKMHVCRMNMVNCFATGILFDHWGSGDDELELSYHGWNESSPALAADVDVVLVTARFGCDHGGVNKMFAAYAFDFPAHAWHNDIVQGLARMQRLNGANVTAVPVDSVIPPPLVVVSYVDRQNTGRTMPTDDHDWLVSTLEAMHASREIVFRHLHMEDLQVSEQLLMAFTSDILIGVHGNGMSHQLWMKPGSVVIEIYAYFPFQYDYYYLSLCMNHTYVGVWNGRVMDMNNEEAVNGSFSYTGNNLRGYRKKAYIQRIQFENATKDGIVQAIRHRVHVTNIVQ